MKNHRSKIKSRSEIIAIIGSRPRHRRVALCHGTFDLVHPGHIRHLEYAKDHADILIASITPDEYVTKANFRPYTPAQLRANNLAVLEMVDYVMIDDAATPLGTLNAIQPDYFAKGFEYAHGHPKTEEERAVVESYGGEMLFTPGDIVQSSSKIITQSPPNIAVDMLIALMEAEGLSFDDLRAAVHAMATVHVHVIGDTIVDTITETVPTGGIGKTPTISVHVQGKRDYVGGAGIVAKHVRAAGSSVTFSTVLGNDHNGEFVIDDLSADGIDLNYVIDRDRPTTNKNAIVAGGYRMLKLDTLDNREIPDKTVNALAADIRETKADIVIFSDFRHGLFTRNTIPILASAIPVDALKVADSQVASRWGNILEFHGFDLITPNEKEARFALGDQDSVVRPLASRLYEESACKVLILKMGEMGILTQCGAVGEPSYLHVVRSFARHVTDAVGCGDALLAYASLGLAVTKKPVIASILGSIAAGLECEHDGNIPIRFEHVLDRLSELEREAQYGPLKESGRSSSAKSGGASMPSISSTAATIVEARG